MILKGNIVAMVYIWQLNRKKKYKYIVNNRLSKMA